VEAVDLLLVVIHLERVAHLLLATIPLRRVAHQLRQPTIHLETAVALPLHQQVMILSPV
jgi:hypothetical protein